MPATAANLIAFAGNLVLALGSLVGVALLIAGSRVWTARERRAE
jgi:hypothetical protein